MTKDFMTGLHRALVKLDAFIPSEFQGAHTRPYTVWLASEEVMPGMASGRSSGTSAGKNEAMVAETLRFLADLRLDDPDLSTVFVVLNEREYTEKMFVEMRQSARIDQLAAQQLVERVPVRLAPGYIQAILKRRTPLLPDWITSGLGRLAESADFLTNAIQFNPLTTNTSTSDGPAGKSPFATMPLKELLAGPPADKAASPEIRARWNTSAALLVRYWLDGAETQRRKFWTYAKRAAVEPATEDLFKECLGWDYAVMQKRLNDYVTRATRRSFTIPVRNFSPAPVPNLRNATEDEMARIRIEWERLRIRYIQSRFPTLAQQYIDEADQTLERVVSAEGQDPSLAGALGLFYTDTNRPDKARPYLEAASQAREVRPRVLLELSRLRFAEAAGRRGERFDPESTAAILTPLELAHRQLPALAGVYRLAADTLLRSQGQPTESQLALLRAGVGLAPRDAGLRYVTAVLHRTAGQTGVAEDLAKQGLLFTPADERFRELLKADFVIPGSN